MLDRLADRRLGMLAVHDTICRGSEQCVLRGVAVFDVSRHDVGDP